MSKVLINSSLWDKESVTLLERWFQSSWRMQSTCTFRYKCGTKTYKYVNTSHVKDRANSCRLFSWIYLLWVFWKFYIFNKTVNYVKTHSLPQKTNMARIFLMKWVCGNTDRKRIKPLWMLTISSKFNIPKYMGSQTWDIAISLQNLWRFFFLNSLLLTKLLIWAT